MTRRNRDWLVLLYCLLAAAGCLLFASKSSPLYPINDWTDANAYLSCGKGMLAGRVMYRDLYEHKGPLLYALHAVCALVDGASFLGVFCLEILALGLFLLAAYKVLTLYGGGLASLAVLPMLAAVVVASFSFQQGDSAEELCLPMLAWSLYSLLHWLRKIAPARMPTKTLLLNGVLCGCVLWMKFTLLGFYIPWVLGMLFLPLKHRKMRETWWVFGWFVAGIGLSTVPWLLYFGLNGALLPWLKTYLYDNLFLYQDEEVLTILGRAKAMLHAAWDWWRYNLGYTIPLTLGVVWFTVRGTRKVQTSMVFAAASEDEAPRVTIARERTLPGSDKLSLMNISLAEKCFVWAMLIVASVGVFIGGKSYVYYGLILAVFTLLGAIPLGRIFRRIVGGRTPIMVALVCLSLIGASWYCEANTYNRSDLYKPRLETMQYQIAAFVQQTPGATLLNYGFMDAGFYTACNIVPNVKYFHQTNVHLQEMLDEQVRYINEGITDYVVTRGKQPQTIANRYDLVVTIPATKGFWYSDISLYRRKGLLPSMAQ